MTNKLFDKIYNLLTPSPLPQAGYVASLPINVKVSLLVWLRGLSPREYFPNLLLTVFFLGASLVLHPASPSEARAFPFLCDLLALNSVLFIFVKITVPRQICRDGSLCPAVVLSVNPPLVAVSANLNTTAEETAPAIKILPRPLRVVSGPPLQIGDRLPAVSLYHSRSLALMLVYETIGLNLRPFDDPHWRDFSPVVIPCVTNDPAAKQNALRRLSEYGDGWAELQAGLAQVPQPYRPGLYRMRQ